MYRLRFEEAALVIMIGPYFRPRTRFWAAGFLVMDEVIDQSFKFTHCHSCSIVVY
jgi:hypothetical protein